VVDAVLVLLLVLAAGAALLLGLRALRYWYGERAGRAYELPVDRRGTVWRAGASGAAALAAAGLAVPLLAGPGTAAPGRPAAAPPHQAPPAPPPALTPTAAPPPEIRTLGHPDGGTLQLLRDGTRVWLPPRYSTPSATGIAYPVVVVHASAADDLALYSAFAEQADRGRADAFLLVTPPYCGTAPDAVLAEVGVHYRVLAARTARGLVGVGPQAACAVREALADRTRYGAAAGVSGTYPQQAAPADSHPVLLLAADDQPGRRASAARLRAALHPKGDQVRLLDGVTSRSALLGDVAAYFTEKLDGPARATTAPEPAPAKRARTTPDASSPTHKGAPTATGPHPARRPGAARTASPRAASPRTATHRTNRAPSATATAHHTPAGSRPHTPAGSRTHTPAHDHTSAATSRSLIRSHSTLHPAVPKDHP
jgi:hypothetical protein